MSNGQVSPPQKVKGANQVEIRFQNHACLFTFYHSQYICLLIYNVQRFKWIIIFEIIFEHDRKSITERDGKHQFYVHKTEINRIASMEFITTTRGGQQLLRDSYLYYKNNGSSYWECKERRSGNGCKIKVVLDEQENFSHQLGHHTHAPNPEAVSALKLRSKMKRDARHTDTATNNIITTNIGGMLKRF